jgi:transcriptional regulator with GAF, ATPase, and Fis domain
MTKRGKFALADGGSIFLDEIGTMSTAIQSKLLRVLQEREFEPLGAERTQRVDVRVIAATNRDLKQMVSDGKFQEDLYYRLNVIPIDIPPLRERREDIAVLVEHFVEKHRQRTGKKIDQVDEGVIAALERYDWPGNVRELENTIERAVVLTTGSIINTAAISLVGATSTSSAGLRPRRPAHGRREVFRQDLGPLRDDDRGLDHVQQLAHVARPVPGLEHGQHLRAEPLAEPEPLVEGGREVLGEQRDVRAPLAQRGHGDRDRAEAVEEVLAEKALPHHGLEVPVGGGDDADVHLELGRAAEVAEGGGVEHAEELHLRGRAHLAERVEEFRMA